MALFHGILLCREAWFRDIICYSDSLQTIRLVQTEDVRYHHYGNEIEIIRQFLAKDWTVRLYHAFREGNMSAEVLTKLGTRTTSNLVILNNPPIELQLVLLADVMRVSYSRA
jgi:hypothetical protein